ncbi:uncharacterized protein C4orf45 homolog [Salarias fasciatus]|uniref:uncharacterized protein C4orf45 homolog n=1 Tax=Salarias fasciatus TaxID=181472 RepID=UPI0011767B21|nr:uncharacterized protein C4orf45 homolog [Salarias fasciatus]
MVTDNREETSGQQRNGRGGTSDEAQGREMMQSRERPCGGRVIFTGPDGTGDYRPRSGYSPRYVGVGSPSPEATGDLGYLSRAAPGAPPPGPRGGCVGEVGWGWQYNQLLNSRTLLSNMQIKRSEFRAALEDRVTQRVQDSQ